MTHLLDIKTESNICCKNVSSHDQYYDVKDVNHITMKNGKRHILPLVKVNENPIRISRAYKNQPKENIPRHVGNVS